jgi:hypothetical protein
MDWINQKLNNTKDPLETASMILNQANATIDLKTSQFLLVEKEFLNSIPYVTNQLQDLSKCLPQDKFSKNPEENPELSELFMLDLVVSRMENTRNALIEVYLLYLIIREKWTSFAIEMDAIFDSGDYETAGQRLKVFVK